jgi:hypothetical protein
MPNQCIAIGVTCEVSALRIAAVEGKKLMLIPPPPGVGVGGCPGGPGGPGADILLIYTII